MIYRPEELIETIRMVERTPGHTHGDHGINMLDAQVKTKTVSEYVYNVSLITGRLKACADEVELCMACQHQQASL